MSSSDPLARLVTAVSANVLRAVGALMIVLPIGVAATSAATEYGLAAEAASGPTAVFAADAGAVGALVEFAAVHPAYPAAALIGIVLVVAGDETPLIGN